MIKKLFLFIIVFIMFVLSSITVFGEEGDLSFNMDNMNGVTLLPAGGVAVAGKDGENNVVLLKHTANSGNSSDPNIRDTNYPQVRFPIETGKITSKFVAFEFNFKATSSISYGYVNIYNNGTSGRGLSLNFSNGTFSFNGHAGNPPIVSKYSPDRWCNMKVLLNYNNNTLNLLIDGVLAAENVRFKTTVEGAAPSRLDIEHRMNNDFYVDDVKIYATTKEAFEDVIFIEQDFSAFTSDCVSVPATYPIAGTPSIEDTGVKMENGASVTVTSNNKTEKKLILDFSLKVWGDTEQPLQVKGITSSGTSSIGVNLYFRNGLVGYKSPDYNDLCSFSQGEYHDISLVMDSVDHVFDLYIDGEFVGGGLEFRDKKVDLLTTLTFASVGKTGMWVDNIRMYDLCVPESLFYISNSVPSHNGTFSMINADIILEFNTEINPIKTTARNFVLSGSGTVPEISNIDVKGKKVILTYTDNFLYNSAYSLKITNLTGENSWVMRDKSISFNTAEKIDLIIAEPTFKIGDDSISALDNGVITVGISSKKTTEQIYNGVLIAVVRKNGYLVDMDVSLAKDIFDSETKFETKVNILDKENSKIEVYFWNGFSNAESYLDTYEFSVNGGSFK